MNRILTILAAAALTGVMSATAWAQSAYPSKPVTLVMPFPPGGGTDSIARIYANALSDALGQPVVVENKAGGAGTIGTTEVARARPDGHTLLFTISGPVNLAPHFFPDLSYDTARDLAPVAAVAQSILLLAAQPGFAPGTMKELVEYAQSGTAPVRFGTAGVGSPDHLMVEVMNHVLDASMIHVPYQGGAPMMVDLLGGRLDVGIASTATIMPHVEAGKLKVIAQVETKRSDRLPDIEATDETVPGTGRTTWYGIFAPAGTAPEIIARLNEATAEIMARDDVTQALDKIGVVPMYQDAESFGALVASEIERFGRQIEETGLNVKQ